MDEQSTSLASRRLPAMVAAVAALLVYCVSIGGTFVYDDFDVFERDPRLADPSQWGRYWTEGYNGGIDNLYRPLVSMTYAIQWKLHGLRPWPFHLVNIALHAGICALVAELGRRILGWWAGLVGGVLFAVHPVHVEAVSYIVGRAELMCALGVLGALVLAGRRPMTIGRVVAIFSCFVVAVLSKEQGMLLPLLLLVAVWCFPGERSVGAERSAYLLLTLLLCLGLAGYIAWREYILKFWWDRSFLDWTIQPMAHSHGADRWLMPLALLGRYVALLVLPIKLSPDYGGSVIGSSVRLVDPYFWIGALTAVLWVAGLILAMRRRAGAIVFLLLALALTYGVIGNIIALIGTNFAERLIYLPSAFALVLIASGTGRYTAFVIMLVVVLLSIRTITYANRWNDRRSFYETSIRDQPQAVRLYMLLASDLMAEAERLEAEGRRSETAVARDRAADVIARGIEQAPDYHMIWIESGVIALSRDHLDQADHDLERAISLSKNPGPAANWQGKVAERRAATRTSH